MEITAVNDAVTGMLLYFFVILVTLTAEITRFSLDPPDILLYNKKVKL